MPHFFFLKFFCLDWNHCKEKKLWSEFIRDNDTILTSIKSFRFQTTKVHKLHTNLDWWFLGGDKLYIKHWRRFIGGRREGWKGGAERIKSKSYLRFHFACDTVIKYTSGSHLSKGPAWVNTNLLMVNCRLNNQAERIFSTLWSSIDFAFIPIRKPTTKWIKFKQHTKNCIKNRLIRFDFLVS